jgi:hypothetical protein
MGIRRRGVKKTGSLGPLIYTPITSQPFVAVHCPSTSPSTSPRVQKDALSTIAKKLPVHFGQGSMTSPRGHASGGVHVRYVGYHLLIILDGPASDGKISRQAAGPPLGLMAVLDMKKKN